MKRIRSGAGRSRQQPRIGAPDPALTPNAGLAVLTELCDRVGAGNAAGLCDLGVFVEEPAEPITADDLDAGVNRVGGVPVAGWLDAARAQPGHEVRLEA